MHEERVLVRELGLSEALAIGLGAMGGAGIFVLAAFAVGRAGPGAILSFTLAGLICLPIAMTVSELATGMPKAGGSYYFICRALGPLVGSIVGPANWLGLTFAGGFFLIALGEYLAGLLGLPPWTTTLAVGLGLTYLNYRGAKIAGGMQKAVVFTFLGILALFVALGLFRVESSLYHPFLPFGLGQAVRAVGLIIVSYTGFEKISTLSEEIKDVGRNLPRAIVGAVLIAMFLYAAVLFVLSGLLSPQAIGQTATPLMDAAGRVAGPLGRGVMLIAALLATASSANAAIMASSRINFAMGRDRILPDWFNKIHSNYLTPYRSVLATGGLATLLALSGQAEVLAEISSALFMVNYAFLSLSCLVMRRARPAWYKPAYRIPLYPWLPIVGGTLCLLVITTMERATQAAGLVLVLSGIAWYYAWARDRTKVEGVLGPLLQRERIRAHAAEMSLTGGREILVLVANPKTVKSLVALASAIARGEGKGARIAALKIVTVPLQTPLHAAQEYAVRQERGEESILDQAVEYGKTMDVNIQPLLRAAHQVPTGILSVAESRDAGLILMGWWEPPSRSDIETHAAGAVIRGAKCNVAVLRDRGLDDEVRSILIPAAEGTHARLGLLLAYAIAASTGAELTVLRVTGPDGDIEGEERALERLVTGVLGVTEGRVATRVVKDKSVIGGILAETKRTDYDLLVIGAPGEWTLRDALFGSLPDIVANKAPCSVLMVRRYEPKVSWLRRTLKRLRKHEFKEEI